jgi:DNA helicase HerA-like ATPase
MRTDVSYVGRVIQVVGAKVIVEIVPELPTTTPIIDGRLHRIGQIGSFVRFPLGFLNVFGLVSMVGVAEAIDPLNQPQHLRARRTLEVQLVGEVMGGGSFQRGISQYPSLDDEVHVVTQEDLSQIYRVETGGCTVEIGHHSASESLLATVDLDKLVTRHSAVFGSTGSGKSNTVAALLNAVSGSSRFPSANILVIDPHGEYGSAFHGKSRVFRIDDPQFPLELPYWALSFDELAWFLVDRRSASETIYDTRLRDAVYDLRKKSAVRLLGKQVADEITPDSPVPFDIRELWYRLDREERVTWKDTARTKEALIQEGNPTELRPAAFEPHGAGSALPHKNMPNPPMGAYVNKIITRLRDKRFSFLLSPGNLDDGKADLHHLISNWIGHSHGITILDLGGVPSEVTDLVVGLVTRLLFETMFWGRDLSGTGRQRPLLMVFEEAHTYLPRAESKFLQGYARQSVQRLLKEGRKYGIGAVVVSQRPSEVDETIVSQCGTFFSLRLSNSQDQGRVAAMVPDEVEGLTNLLPSLRTGEALVVGEAVPIPSRVRVHLVSPRPDSTDPSVSERWSASRESDPAFNQAILNWRRQRRDAPSP